MTLPQHLPTGAVHNWVIGARLKTLPVSYAPLAVGTAIAHASGPLDPSRTALTVVLVLGFVLGTNFFNDYSDGIRGVDDHRAGPTRVVGSGRATPRQVFRHGAILYAIGALAGLYLAVTVSWWLLAVTVFIALGGWFYTGGPRPYGYHGLGEISIFVYHGVVFVCTPVYVQTGGLPWEALAGSVPVGLLSCALLTTNNLRDIPTDAATGKITLAVRLGAARTRAFYVGCVAGAFATALAPALAHPWALLVLGAVPFAVVPVRTVLSGAGGRALIPALEHTCLLLLAFGTLQAIGLAL
ncbi:MULTISPECIES: 1,4-dihydroxy-2-naphthoate polyprenyltransferase [Streptomyces]|uniref:1,4-dihydroxy-2-naphthoate polyprenyltransferase n=1 Tax=Streptomyces TaxID=1883 RepID=UPI001CC90176|nr:MULTISPECIES: 1,4-dihydroxy-2-naphthoate polyprenyltransferase [Streptomyces]UBI35086.1 1,4-dihydroxy-2-naphthoate polyprenyltransferase [Streptomyces mobaraensis]UKW27679.1 1,4-dihydroxy-2-naphthoate polyprenyltransferase [Streptomyces sp. TYQ1024]